jgi:toxin ParE1/3/4
MRAIFHPEADEDFDYGLQHYAAIQADLARRFLKHIEELTAEIVEQPKLYRIFRRPAFRRHFRRPFPYALVYIVKPDHVRVLAVMHFRQPPGYWLHRAMG